MRCFIVIALAGILLALPVGAQEGDKPLVADPANDLFELAQLSYQEALEDKNAKRRTETLEVAIRQFERFREAYPEHANAMKSWYYTAVCYQKLGNDSKFRAHLNAIVTGWKKGPLVGAAAYQLADEHYKAKQWEKAAALYKLAASESDNKASRHRSIYSRALCFEKLEQRKETIAALLEVLADLESPYRERAEVVLAHYYKEDDLKEEALAHFINLAKSKDAKTRADATLQCALLARDLKKKDFAMRYFELILTTPGLEEWRGESQLALLSQASLDGEHQRVVELYKRGGFQLKKEQEARRLQLVAKSYEALGQEAEATALYRELERVAPNAMTGFEAAYVVLSRAYQTGSGDLVQQAQSFLKRYEEKHPADARIHNARLMLAEAHFKAKRFGPAAAAYGEIDLAHIAKENHAGLRYRLASSLLESGNRPAAVAAFGTFLTNHPDDPRVPNALVKRADTLLEDGKTTEALAEYDLLISKSKDPSLREYGWVRKAELSKEANDLEAFEECHRHLIADFPQREPKMKAASEFWIGWSLFRRDKLAESIVPFERARAGDSDDLGRESTLHLALAHYSLQEQAELKAELDRLLIDYPKEAVPRPVFAWLGTKLAAEENYKEAWRYLSRAITPDQPTGTKIVVWRAAGRSALEAGAFREALRPLDIIMKVEDNPFRKAETSYFIARAHFGLKEMKEAQAAAQACLELRPQGDLNAETRLLLGDIAMASGEPAEAAKHYVVVAELYAKTPEMKRRVLKKAINALELKGDKESLESVSNYRKSLEALGPAENP